MPQQIGDQRPEKGDKAPPLTKRRKRKSEFDPFENFLMDSIKKRREDEMDEDRLWALSLVPSLQKLDDYRKSKFKIDVQNLLLNASYPSQPFINQSSTSAATFFPIHYSQPNYM